MTQDPGTDDPGIVRISLTQCVACGHKVDAIGTADGSPGAPEPGDWIICINCGEPQILEPGGILVRPPLGAYHMLQYEDPEYHGELERMRNRVHNLPRRA